MTWQRLEGTTIDAELMESQQAAVADPYWMIGRQWQTGELTGDDAASPLIVDLELEYAPITLLRPGGRKAPLHRLGALDAPVEAVVEAEPIWRGPAGVRLSAESGLQFLRSLEGLPAAMAAAAADAVRREFPLRAPRDDGLELLGRAELELLARRSFDAAALYRRIEDDADAGLAELAPVEVAERVEEWARWHGAAFVEPERGQSAWSPQRMEYALAMAAHPRSGAELVLEAPEYTGGRLDWDAFDLGAGRWGTEPAGRTITARLIAARARYPGQAASRFWQLEDAEVSFGDLHLGPTDVAKAVVAGYGMTFGDDFYLTPVRVPAGGLLRVTRLTVHDTFGRTTRIRSCAELDGPDRSWRWFELSGDPSADAAELQDRTAPWLLLPPVVAGVVESRPVEDVLMIRDEVANLAWGVEVRIEGASGRPVDRAALARANRPPAPAPVVDDWRYDLTTSVLDHQIPLVPVRAEDGTCFLQRGRLARAVEDSDVVSTGALGQVLEAGRRLLVHDEEIPVGGVRITRSWQVARAPDGSVVCWMGRRKTVAPPRRAPGLGFDQVRT